MNCLSLTSAKHHVPQPYHFSASPEQFHISAVSSEGTCRNGEISLAQNCHLGWGVSFLLSEPHSQPPCQYGWTVNNKFLRELGNLMSSQKEKELPFWRIGQDIQETLHFTQVLLPIWNSIRDTNTDYKNSSHTCRKTVFCKRWKWANTQESSEDPRSFNSS